MVSMDYSVNISCWFAGLADGWKFRDGQAKPQLKADKDSHVVVLSRARAAVQV